MIPKSPVNNVVACPEEAEIRRRVLFQLGNWEIVLYKNYEKAMAVHTCRKGGGWYDPASSDPDQPVGPRVVMRASALKAPSALCWNCDKPIPDEIIAVTELYNA